MFARQAFATATRGTFSSFAPAASRQSIRRYATDGPQKGTQFLQPRNFIFVATGGVAAAFGLYWLKGQQSILIQPAKPAIPALNADDQWVDLKLLKVEPYNHNTKKFIFELPSDDHVSGVKIASCVLTKYQPEGGKPIIRPYTPISDEDARGYLTLLIKQYPKGPMSTHIHDMAPDQRLWFKGPIPKYPWEANKHEHIALIAGGTGITPMWQLIRHIFKNKDDKTKVTLVFGNIAEEDILLRQELAAIENEYPQRFRAFYTLEKPPKEFVGNKGYVTKELLKQVLPEPKSENIKVFVCGPPGMMDAISGNKKSPKEQGDLKGILKDLGYSQDQVFKF
ncbi:Flavohemoprotein [Drechslerella dactyloides]|uniref:NADH-cytochrome b5 reductase n=1 Tax=Drechslerella dactyloides TaxID=74499 RepID=A0AAD6J837_DREDA|nr:Flavohemoprotein [Drechslerella dactyloides]